MMTLMNIVVCGMNLHFSAQKLLSATVVPVTLATSPAVVPVLVVDVKVAIVVVDVASGPVPSG